jgi:hypothetical protein
MDSGPLPRPVARERPGRDGVRSSVLSKTQSSCAGGASASRSWFVQGVMEPLDRITGLVAHHTFMLASDRAWAADPPEGTRATDNSTWTATCRTWG